MKKAMAATELKNLLDSNRKDLKVIEVRSPEEYYTQHLAFAENWPLTELENSADKLLEKEDIIVCVCNKGHERSQDAAGKLSERGYKNLFELEKGINLMGNVKNALDLVGGK